MKPNMGSMKQLAAVLLGLLFSLAATGQSISEWSVKIEKEVISNDHINLKAIKNVSEYDIDVVIKDGSDEIGRRTLIPGETVDLNLNCTQIFISQSGNVSSGVTVWSKRKTEDAWKKLQQLSTEKASLPATASAAEIEEIRYQGSGTPSSRMLKKRTSDQVMSTMLSKIETDGFYSSTSILNDAQRIDEMVKELSSEKVSDEFIKIARAYLDSENIRIQTVRQRLPEYVDELISGFKSYKIEGYSCRDSVKVLLNMRISQREKNLAELESRISSASSAGLLGRISEWLSQIDSRTLLNVETVFIVLLLILIWVILSVRRRKGASARKQVQVSAPSPTEASPAIVVRRKTTSILKRQSLEDVIGNDDYFQIDTADFCADSAVRRIYVKNTCIKSIYNLYAEDLRNADSPKEDGCMVLGRWVFDEQLKEYYVSLEEVVLPGDDAVFQEYELNFGGKIKLKVASELRRLRRESNLQYDLTCWVHSHPGLGVFFSNYDANVQMQLKHPSHPEFLTAIVVDILTPDQEFGIFTFRHDSTINSKSDLARLYSLEEMYKWALESERNSVRKAFKEEDFYNVLANAEYLPPECQILFFNANSIIDMTGIVSDPEVTGLAGYIFGSRCESAGKQGYSLGTVSRNMRDDAGELVGCLVIGTHCSIPTIRKATSDSLEKIKFILFYSVTDGTVTVIPVVENSLCTEEKYYVEDKFDNLKIWTRRRR